MTASCVYRAGCPAPFACQSARYCQRLRSPQGETSHTEATSKPENSSRGKSGESPALLPSNLELSSWLTNFIAECRQAIKTNRESGQVWVRRDDLAQLLALRDQRLAAETSSPPSYEAIADMLPAILATGTEVCPLCGRTGVHEHSPEEIVIYRNGVKYGRSLSGSPVKTNGEPV